jgi:hypothetical protein
MTAHRLRYILMLGTSVQQPGIDPLISKSFQKTVAAVLAPFERLSLFIVGFFVQVSSSRGGHISGRMSTSIASVLWSPSLLRRQRSSGFGSRGQNREECV